MARTYNATRTLENRREHFGRALPQDARTDRKAARMALRATKIVLDSNRRLWQTNVSKHGATA